MAIELPDIFQPRNLIAVGLAGAAEMTLSHLGGLGIQGFAMDSFLVFAMVFVLIGWLLEKAYRILFLKKRVIDEIRDQTEIKTQLPGDTMNKSGQ